MDGKPRRSGPLAQTPRVALSRREALRFLGGTGLAATLGLDAPGSASAQGTAGERFKVAFVHNGSVNDGAWTQAHADGRIALEEALPEVETAYQENVPDNPVDAERVIRGFAQQGYQTIFTTTLGFMDPTINAAKDFPETVFVNISGDKTAPNVGTGMGRIEEPRHVAGMIAGKMTTSNLIGYVAAFPTFSVIRGIDAFTLGARKVNPGATVRVVWTNTWFDAQKERAAAEVLLDAGADVIAQHQDTPAAQQVAEERGKYGIGHARDMSPFAPQATLTTRSGTGACSTSRP